MTFRATELLSTVLVCLTFFVTSAAPATGAEDLPDSKWYTIQVSSSREAEGAEQHVAALKAQGLDAVTSYEVVEGKGMWYRVYIGRFKTKKAAETEASRMVEEGVISGYWVKELKDIDILSVPLEPDRTKQAVVKKEGPLEPEVQRVDSGKLPEPQADVKDQVQAPQLPSEAKVEEVTEPSKDIADRTTPVPEPESTPEKSPEPQISLQEQAETLPTPAEEEGPAIAASSGDIADRRVVKESSIRAPTSRSKTDDRGPFSLGMRLGGVYLPGLDKFTVSTPATIWCFEEKFLITTLVPSYSFNKSFALEGSVEKILNAEFDFLYATLGPKFRFLTSNSKGLFNPSPYIRGAVAWGDMSWDDMPGSFDSSIGGELGTGLDIITFRSSIKLGIEISYRSIKLDYNIPSDLDVISSRDNIDFSGYSFTGFLNYYF